MKLGCFEKGQEPWNKGIKKDRDLNEIRICKDCKTEKLITLFVTGTDGLYRYKCKECRQSSRRTGKPNTGRFLEGHDKGKRFKNGHTPWYKVKGVPAPNKGTGKRETRDSAKTKEWCNQVKERDGRKCVKCKGDSSQNC